MDQETKQWALLVFAAIVLILGALYYYYETRTESCISSCATQAPAMHYPACVSSCTAAHERKQ